MLHPETLEAYRRMTPGERLQLTLEMIQENTPYLFVGTPEQVDRKFELLQRQNDERNRRMLQGLARTGRRHEQRRTRVTEPGRDLRALGLTYAVIGGIAVR